MSKAIFDSSEEERTEQVTENKAPKVEKINFNDFDEDGTLDGKFDEKEQEANLHAAMNQFNAFNNQDDTSLVSKEEEDMMKISEDDVEMAQQIIFKGFAMKESVMEIAPDTKFVITTSTAEEISIVNYMMMVLLNENENVDGKVEIPQVELTAIKNSYNLALSYIGMDYNDIMEDDPSCRLETIKAGIKKMSEMYAMGDSEKADKIRQSIYDSVRKRSSIIRQMSIPLIDFISDEKYKFDAKMYNVMKRKSIIPKS